MKKTTILLVTMMLLMLITVSAKAEENTYKGEFIGLGGNQGLVEMNYQLSDKFKVSAHCEDNALTADLHFQPADWFGIKVGERYEDETKETNPYGGIDFFTPFGAGNLKLTGYYNYNYKGKDWTDYEVALRIEMYKNQFLYAGVRGDEGDGFTPYDYNEANDPLFFIRGDFNWQWGKFGVNLKPLLYVTGYVLYDTNFRYDFNDRTSLVLNVTDYYDQDQKYRLGIQYKF